jgi:hypothetical protein
MTEQEAANERWRKRVSIRVAAGKVATVKKWFGTDNGQMTLVAIFIVMMIVAGAAEKL